MAGAPSQLDLFDHKPDLARRFREPLPPSVSQGQRVTAMTRAPGSTDCRAARSTAAISTGWWRITTKPWA